MPRAEHVLDVMPAVYGASDRLKLLSRVVTALADPMDEADSSLFRIERAHRLLLAERSEDLVRLAAVLRLDATHFDDLVNDPGLSPEQARALIRERVQRVARVTLRGLGTPWAVLESAAAFMNATIVPDEEGGPLIKPIDGDGFSHRVRVRFEHAEGRPTSRIVLHENPFRRHEIDAQMRWPRDAWEVDNQNVEVSPIRLTIRGIGDRTVSPTIFAPGISEGVVFNGIVPDGSTLVIDEATGATLDGRPVDDWLLAYRGAITDHSVIDGVTYAETQGQEGAPFDVGAGPWPESGYGRPDRLPRPPIGRSRWHFGVAFGVYDSTAVDYCVYETPIEPVGRYDQDFAFDACVFDYPPSATVGLSWDERIPCSFKLLLPPRIPPPGDPPARGQERPAVDYAARVGALIPRFRAAGVRAWVEAADDAWVVGQSVVRTATAADGLGIDIDSTRVRDPGVDAFVAFDPVVT